MTPLDYPNLQVLGLDPPWVEGTGGTEETVEPTAKTTKAAKKKADEDDAADDKNGE